MQSKTTPPSSKPILLHTPTEATSSKERQKHIGRVSWADRDPSKRLVEHDPVDIASANQAVQRIDHAGFDRYILHNNPKRYDIEGYELDAEDEDPEADEDAAERDPYGEIMIHGDLILY